MNEIECKRFGKAFAVKNMTEMMLTDLQELTPEQEWVHETWETFSLLQTQCKIFEDALKFKVDQYETLKFAYTNLEEENQRLKAQLGEQDNGGEKIKERATKRKHEFSTQQAKAFFRILRKDSVEKAYDEVAEIRGLPLELLEALSVAKNWAQ